MKKNLIIIDNILNTIKVNNNENNLLYIIKEIIKGIIIKQEDEMKVIINSRIDFDERFNINLNIKGEFDFNNQVNNNANFKDKNI